MELGRIQLPKTLWGRCEYIVLNRHLIVNWTDDGKTICSSIYDNNTLQFVAYVEGETKPIIFDHFIVYFRKTHVEIWDMYEDRIVGIVRQRFIAKLTICKNNLATTINDLLQALSSMPDSTDPRQLVISGPVIVRVEQDHYLIGDKKIHAPECERAILTVICDNIIQYQCSHQEFVNFVEIDSGKHYIAGYIPHGLFSKNKKVYAYIFESPYFYVTEVTEEWKGYMRVLDLRCVISLAAVNGKYICVVTSDRMLLIYDHEGYKLYNSSVPAISSLVLRGDFLFLDTIKIDLGGLDINTKRSKKELMCTLVLCGNLDTPLRRFLKDPYFDKNLLPLISSYLEDSFPIKLDMQCGFDPKVLSPE